jgi:hypothetical protein
VASGNGQSSPIRLPAAPAVGFVLDVTAAGSAADDLLDVFVQTKIGDNWFDVVHFTQVLGNGGAKRYVAKVVGALATAEYEVGSALAAAAVRNLLGDEWAARWVVTNGAGTHSFTFSVTAVPL